MLNVKPADNGTPPTVWGSHDEGETWGQIGGIDPGTSEVLSLGFSMTRLDEGTLLVPVLVGADRIGDREAAEITPAVCRIYRSHDGGSTWSDYSALGEWSCEVNVAQLSTGRLLAAIRYQRPSLSDDPPDLLERTGALAAGQHIPVQACIRRPFRRHRRYMDTATATRHRAWAVLRIRRWVVGQPRGSNY